MNALCAPQMSSNGWSVDYKISVIIPTRDRISLLFDCLNSLLNNSYQEERLFEVILLIDSDDTKTLQFAIELQSKFNFINLKDNTECNSLLIMVVKRSEYMQRDYNNAGAVAAKGELVFVLNDDAVISTKNWDYHIYNFYKNNKSQDDIMMIALSDDSHNSESLDSLGQIRDADTHGPCFPIITKTFVNHLRGIFPSNIRMWGADWILYKIFQYVNRVYRLYNISITHNSFHSANREKDQINDYIEQISSKPQYLPTIPEYIDYIQSIIVKK